MPRLTLTFDNGPWPGPTDAVLDVLAARNLRTTFFVVGERLKDPAARPSAPRHGPVGELVLAQGRHGMCPAHIHFLISAPGYRELVTALYLEGDAHLGDDVVFGASADLVAREEPSAPTCPIKGLPGVRFDFSLSREAEVDRLGGRVGADPAAVAARSEAPPASTAAE